jgi:Domain of unknown function (DUF4290)
MIQKKTLDMEYNSQKDEVVVPEYGRNVQNMIRYVKEVEDPRARQILVEKIIDMMIVMYPQNRSVEDYREKLWKHVFRMADYDLSVETPFERPTLEAAMRKPDRVPYPRMGSGFRHYGNSVKELIAKAIEMEPGGKRDGLTATIASYMKLAYRTWNKEHFVSDEIIKTDLEILSKGLLTMDNDTAIENLTPGDMKFHNPPTNNRRRGGGQSGGRQRNQGGGGGGRNYKQGGGGGYKRGKRK